jgi:NTE family protein
MSAPVPLSPQAHQTLSTLPALRGIPVSDRAAIAELFREISLPSGAVLFQEGDVGAALYVIVSGELEVVASGRPVARLGPGELVGEMALLTGAPRSATVVVTRDVHLLVLEVAAYRRLLEIHPRLYEQMAAILSRRLAVTSRGAGARRCEIVFVHDRGRWPERTALVDALAAHLERETGRPTALLTVAADGRAATRGRRVVLAPGRREDGAFRDRLVSALSEAGAAAGVVLVEADAASPEITALADTVLTLSDGSVEPEPVGHGPRQIVVHDRRLGHAAAHSHLHRAVLPADEPQRTRALGRLARVLARRSVGIALGSGAAYGLAHVGVLDVLEQGGVPIDCIAGTSIGAIVGAYYALGMPAAAMRTKVCRYGDAPGAARLLPSLLPIALDLNLFRPGIFSGKRFLRFLDSLTNAPGKTFADVELPLRIVATDIDTGARVEIVDGLLADAMRASCSAPGILSPYRVGDHVCIDGGMCDPVPIDTARTMGADFVIAVNPVPALDPATRNPLDTALRRLDAFNPVSYLRAGRSLPNLVDVMARTILIMQHELGNARAGEADLLISPRLSRFWVLDFWNVRALIHEGAAAARAALPAIREKIAERGGRGAAVSPVGAACVEKV